MLFKRKPDPSKNRTARSSQMDWQELNEPGIVGAFVKSLRCDEKQRRSPAILLKFAPLSKYPTHSHPGGEEIFVLSGSVKVGTAFLKAGDYLYTAPNNVHSVFSEEGCELLVIVPEEVVIIDLKK